MILPPYKDPSCVLWYDFTSIKNNTVYDQSQYGNHGTVYGATQIGNFGLHGLHFDGVDDYVASSFAPFQDGDSYTQIIFAKVENNSSPYWIPLIEFKYNENTISIEPSGEAYAGIYTDYDNGKSYSMSIADNVFNQKNMYALVANNVNKKGYVYLNAELKNSITFQGNTYNLTGRIAKIFQTQNTRFLQGNVYFVALYNRALSNAEIRELYYYLTKGIKSVVPSRFVGREVMR